jgi:hypothetical protein
MRMAGSAATGHGIEPDEPLYRVAHGFDKPMAGST